MCGLGEFTFLSLSSLSPFATLTARLWTSCPQVQAGRVHDGQITGEVGLVPENYLTLIESEEGRAAGAAAAEEGVEQEGEKVEKARDEQEPGEEVGKEQGKAEEVAT